MKSSKKITTIIFLCILALLATVSTSYGTNSHISTHLKSPTGVKAKKIDAHTIKITWHAAERANGYIIYIYNPTLKKYIRLKTLKSSFTVAGSPAGYRHSGLAQNTTYRYKVVAYKKISNKKTYSKKSIAVSAKTYTSGAAYVNAKKVTVNKTILTIPLNIKCLFRLKAKVIPAVKGKKVINKNVRWYSTDKSVATICSKGYITVKKAGSCRIYAVAHNGIKSPKVKIIVPENNDSIPSPCK